jgi:xanthine dehydrogenase accessory factor
VLEHLDAGRTVAVVVRVPTEVEPRPGRLLVPTDGPVEGTLDQAELDHLAVDLAGRALEGEGPNEGVHELTLSDGTEVEVYLELHAPSPELMIVGAGHIAQPLSMIGALLGFRVVVVDDRPEFATAERFPDAERVARVDFSDPFRDLPVGRSTYVVLVTRGHKYDYECLRRLLARDPLPAYLGMIGSRRRVRATFAQLLDEGVSRERLTRVRAPVGLDLRAQTPAEIAVSVAAEIVASWRDGTGQPLSDRERILERFFPE